VDPAGERAGPAVVVLPWPGHEEPADLLGQMLAELFADVERRLLETATVRAYVSSSGAARPATTTPSCVTARPLALVLRP
jgi:hypothetical protein